MKHRPLLPRDLDAFKKFFDREENRRRVKELAKAALVKSGAPKLIDPALGALAAVADLPGIRHSIEAMMKVHREQVIPRQSETISELPLSWFKDKATGFDVWKDPEGRWSPGAIRSSFGALNPIKMLARDFGQGEALFPNSPILPKSFAGPETLKDVKLATAAKKIESMQRFRDGELVTGPLSPKERRGLEEATYPLPKHMRGALEEAPWFSLPGFGQAKKFLTGLRGASALAKGGSFGLAALPTKAALRTGEALLTVPAAIETGLAKAAVKGVGVAAKPVKSLIGPLVPRPALALPLARRADELLVAARDKTKQSIAEFDPRAKTVAERPYTAPRTAQEEMADFSNRLKDNLDKVNRQKADRAKFLESVSPEQDIVNKSKIDYYQTGSPRFPGAGKFKPSSAIAIKNIQSKLLPDQPVRLNSELINEFPESNIKAELQKALSLNKKKRAEFSRKPGQSQREAEIEASRVIEPTTGGTGLFPVSVRVIRANVTDAFDSNPDSLIRIKKEWVERYGQPAGDVIDDHLNRIAVSSDASVNLKDILTDMPDTPVKKQVSSPKEARKLIAEAARIKRLEDLNQPGLKTTFRRGATDPAERIPIDEDGNIKDAAAPDSVERLAWENAQADPMIAENIRSARKFDDPTYPRFGPKKMEPHPDIDKSLPVNQDINLQTSPGDGIIIKRGGKDFDIVPAKQKLNPSSPGFRAKIAEVKKAFPKITNRKTIEQIAKGEPIVGGKPDKLQQNLGRTDNLKPTRLEMQPKIVKKRRDSTPAGKFHQQLENNDMKPSDMGTPKIADLVADKVQKKEPWSFANFILKIDNMLWDNTSLARLIEDNDYWSTNPAMALHPMSHKSLIARIIISDGSFNSGYARAENFIRYTLEPFANKSVHADNFKKYVLSKHFKSMEDAKHAGSIPSAYKRNINAGEGKEILEPTEGWRTWAANIENGKTWDGKSRLTVSQAEDIKKMSEYFRLEFEQTLKEKAHAGLIEPELVGHLREKYPFFSPIMYDALEQIVKPGQKTGIGAFENAVGKYTDRHDITGALDPIEAYKKHMVRHEWLIQKNEATIILSKYLIKNKIAHDVTDRFYKTRLAKFSTDTETAFKKGKRVGPGDVGRQPGYVEKKITKETEWKDIEGALFDDRIESGFFSYKVGGERKIIGQLDPDGNITVMSKEFWDLLEGRAGFGHRKPNMVEQIFTMLNSFAKSTKTTFNPKFIVANMMIDSVGTLFSAGIMPWKNFYRAIQHIAIVTSERGEEAFVRRAGLDKLFRKVTKEESLYGTQKFSEAMRMRSGRGASGAGPGWRARGLFEKIQTEEEEMAQLLKGHADDFNKKTGSSPEDPNVVILGKSQKTLRKTLRNNAKDFIKWGEVVLKPTYTVAKAGYKGTKGLYKGIQKAGEIAETAPRENASEKFLKSPKSEFGKENFSWMFGRNGFSKNPEIATRQRNHQYWTEYTPRFTGDGTPIEPIIKNLSPDIGEAQYQKYLSQGYEPGDSIWAGVPGRRGLLQDNDSMIRAAVIMQEATLNFYRGGWLIRYLNNYLMFFNPAAEGAKYIFRHLGIDLKPNLRLKQQTFGPYIDPKLAGADWTKKYSARRLSEMKGTKDIKYGVVRPSQVEFGSSSWSPDELINFDHPTTGGKGKKAKLDGFFIGSKRRGITGKGISGSSPAAARLRMAMMFSGSLGLAAYNVQQPGWFNIPAWMRYNAVIIPRPSKLDENGDINTDSDGNPIMRFFTIPHRTREFTLWLGWATYIAEAFYKKEPSDFGLFFEQLWFSSFPTGDIHIGNMWSGDFKSVGGDMVKFLSPDAINLVREQTSGDDDFTDRPIVNPDMANWEVEDQYDKRTSPAVRFIVNRGMNAALKALGIDYRVSPKRADHLLDSVFSGMKDPFNTPADLMVKMAEKFQRDNNAPLEILAAKYRDASWTERNKIKAGLTTDDITELEREVNKQQLPDTVAETIEKTFFSRWARELGGGIREAEQEGAKDILAEEGIKINPQQSTLFAQTAAKARDTQQAGQKIANSKLQFFMKNPSLSANLNFYNPNDLQDSRMLMAPDWITERKRLRSDYFKTKEFLAEYADVFKFPDAIQAQEKQYIQKYYERLSSAASGIKTPTTQAQLLLSAYYSIPTPEDDAGAAKSWVDYFEERREFVEFVKGLGDNVYKEFERIKAQYSTPAEDAYENYIRYKQPYFEIGKDLSELFKDVLSGYGYGKKTIEVPAYAQQWWDDFNASTKTQKDYIRKKAIPYGLSAAEHEKRRKMIEKAITAREEDRVTFVIADSEATMGKYGIPVLEAMMIFWENKSGITPAGIEYQKYYWSRGIDKFPVSR